MQEKTIFSNSLQTRVLFSIFLLLVLALSLSSFFTIQDLKNNFIQAVEWRSVSLAQSIIVDTTARQKYLSAEDIFLNLETAYLHCKKLYEANKSLHVSFISVLDNSGRIAAHSDPQQHGKTLTDPRLLQALTSTKPLTLLIENDYHTLIPIIYQEQIIGTVDIGFPRLIVAQKISSTVKKTATIGLVFFFFVFVLVWVVFRRLIQKPIFSYIEATSNIAKGNLEKAIPLYTTHEFSLLSASLVHMRDSIRTNILKIEEKNEEVRALIACSPVALFSVDLQYKIAIWTTSAEKMFGYLNEEITGQPLPICQQNNESSLDSIYDGCSKGLPQRAQELTFYRKDESFFHGSVLCAPIKDSLGMLTGFMMSVENINERIERDRVNKELQNQLIQAQKMESVGRLAGGVAHDYNNMLGVIIGNAEIAQLKITESDPSFHHFNEILVAARHSADITRQLLAFARKQTISPQIIDLNNNVRQTLQMLKRLLGENIELKWYPSEHPCFVKMDITQVDQILANLCINSRDALPHGGTITIQTSKKEIDENYTLNHTEALAGHYICLSISDNGIGMDKQVREKIFEPFFTTKAVGDGTGLGLATVYGIIKQNSGFVNVYSEPGKGTTFNLYFLEHTNQTESSKEIPQAGTYAGNQETILLVEDEPAILAICKQMLEVLNYQVLATTDCHEALAIAQENRTEITLLLSDVILKNLSGPELCERVRAIIPHLKTLYMSGYTANIIAQQGILPEDINFIQKPFTQQKLAEMVKKALQCPES